MRTGKSLEAAACHCTFIFSNKEDVSDIRREDRESDFKPRVRLSVRRDRLRNAAYCPGDRGRRTVAVMRGAPQASERDAAHRAAGAKRRNVRRERARLCRSHARGRVPEDEMGFPYRAVLFDFDGVLANTEPLHLKAYREALAIRGLTISDEEFYGRYVHYDDAGFFRAIFAERGAPLSDAGLGHMVRRKSEAFRRNLERADMLFPGARETVETLYAQAVLGIVSMAARVEIEAILAAHGLRSLFSVIVAAEDVERKKPDPEPYLAGIELMNRERPSRNRIPADQCVAVEDSAGGVRSAVAAGIYTVGITNTISAKELLAAGASRVISDLRELLDPIL